MILTTVDLLIAIEEGALWEVFMTMNGTEEGAWEPPTRTPLWYLKYKFKIRLKPEHHDDN